MVRFEGFTGTFFPNDRITASDRCSVQYALELRANNLFIKFILIYALHSLLHSQQTGRKSRVTIRWGQPMERSTHFVTRITRTNISRFFPVLEIALLSINIGIMCTFSYSKRIEILLFKHAFCSSYSGNNSEEFSFPLFSCKLCSCKTKLS